MNIMDVIRCHKYNFADDSTKSKQISAIQCNTRELSWEECYLFSIIKNIKENYAYFPSDILEFTHKLDIIFAAELKTNEEFKNCEAQNFIVSKIFHKSQFSEKVNLNNRMEKISKKLFHLKESRKIAAAALKEKFGIYYRQLDEKERKIYIEKMLDKKWRTLVLINNLFKKIK